MKKISYYLVLIVIAGGALAGFWVYQKYFKAEKPKFLLFKVERGSLREMVRVRGEVVAQKDFDLEFPFSGIVEKIFVQEGQRVNQGDLLMKLETADFKLEIKQLEAILAQRQSNLDKLIAGATPEDVNVYKTKVKNAETSLGDAKINLVDKLQDAYTKSDDAIRNRIDQFLSSPRSSNPQLNFSAEAKLESDIENGRVKMETTLVSWAASLANLSINSDLPFYSDVAKRDLTQVKDLLDKSALAVNAARPTATLTQATIDSWKSDVSTGRTNVNTATINLTAAEEKLKTAESNLAVAKDELALKEAKTRDEDIKIAEAQIEETKSKIAALEEKIRKSALYSPALAKVTKVWLEAWEVFRPGQTAVSLSASGHKIQADVSELEIGKIRENNSNETFIKLDAFPDAEFRGRVISVEPKEIIKEDDKYYRVNVYVEPHGFEIRSGMSADLEILISSKDSALKIPELVVYKRNDKEFVIVFEEGRNKEAEVETGISDGESIEIIKGLVEGQTVVVSAD